MKNEFIYLQKDNVYHIYLGVLIDRSYTIVDKIGFDIASSYSGWVGNIDNYAIIQDSNKILVLSRLILDALGICMLTIKMVILSIIEKIIYS